MCNPSLHRMTKCRRHKGGSQTWILEDFSASSSLFHLIPKTNSPSPGKLTLRAAYHSWRQRISPPFWAWAWARIPKILGPSYQQARITLTVLVPQHETWRLTFYSCSNQSHIFIGTSYGPKLLAFMKPPDRSTFFLKWKKNLRTKSDIQSPRL